MSLAEDGQMLKKNVSNIKLLVLAVCQPFIPALIIPKVPQITNYLNFLRQNKPQFSLHHRASSNKMR